MNLTQKFLSFTLLGAEWVMWLLIILSVISVAVMIERIRYFAARKVDLRALAKDARAAAISGDMTAVEKKWGHIDAIEVTVALAGLREAHKGPDAAAEAMIAAKAEKRPDLERNLAYLGTLGNNAPFVGLFGTVLGIIKAFKDLSQNTDESANAVMAGISEALVATAIGLLVALPAVVMFNYLNRRVRGSVVGADSVAHEMLIELKAEPRRAKTEAA